MNSYFICLKPIKTMNQLPKTCLAHLFLYLDPLSRWYLSLTCQRFNHLYHDSAMQYYLCPENKYWFERSGNVWSGEYPEVVNVPKNNLHQEMKDMLNECLQGQYIQYPSYGHYPDIIKSKISNYDAIITHLRIPYSNKTKAPIQIGISSRKTNYLLLYYQSTVKSDHHLIVTLKSLNANYNEIISGLVSDWSRARRYIDGYTLESFDHNWHYHGQPAYICEVLGSSFQSISYNNGSKHGLCIERDFCGQGYDNTNYWYRGLKHGFHVVNGILVEYFLVNHFP